VPPFPGTQKTCLIRVDSSSFFAIACSRPPFPTTKTFTASSPLIFLPEWPLCSVCTYLSVFCTAVNYAMLGAREWLDVALLSTGGALLLFGGSACERIRCFCNNRMDRGNHGGIAPTSCASRTELEAFPDPGCCGYSLIQYFYLTCYWLIYSVITLTVLDAFQLTSCTQINQRLSRGVGAGLFNLSAFFKAQE